MMPQPAPKNSAWLNTAETVLLTSSIGTSIASVVLQQLTFAAITSVQLSLVVGLNSWSRKRLDDLNQQNRNAIAQIQQQLLSEQKSLGQLQATTRQLPTYQDVATLQQQLEQLKTDHQKRLSQLNQDINNQENQFDQINLSLSSLYQRVHSLPSVDADALQNRIHELKAYFEVKVRDLEGRLNQSDTPRIENQLGEIEQTVHQLKGFVNPENISKIFENQIQGFKKETQELNFELHEISQHTDSNSQALEAIIARIQKLESKNNKTLEPTGSVEELIDFLQSEIDELDKRYKKLSGQLDANFSNVAQRFQRIQVDLVATSNTLRSEIAVLRHYVNSHSHAQKEKICEGKTETICERCSKVCKTIVRGGFVNNCNFCSESCKREYELIQGREGH